METLTWAATEPTPLPHVQEIFPDLTTRKVCGLYRYRFPSCHYYWSTSQGQRQHSHYYQNRPTHGLNDVGVKEGIVSLESNDDFVMGAPPGASGVIKGAPPTTVPADLESRDTKTKTGLTRCDSQGCYHNFTSNDISHNCSSRHSGPSSAPQQYSNPH